MPATTHYDDHDSGSDATTQDRPEMLFTPYTTVRANLTAAFGTGSEYGQSLGVTFDDIVVEDGCLYADPEKGKLKLFSWKQANDLTPAERFDRGEEPSAEDADEIITKTYFGNTKTYELIGARVPELTDEDGDIVVEATSRVRDYEFTDGGIEFGDFEDLGGDMFEVEDVLVWYDGNEEYGPSTSAKNLAKTLTQYGDLAVQNEDDIHNWLHDATGDNVLREELQDRRVRFFIVQRDGDNYTYNLPIVEDVELGEQILADNYDDSEEGGTGNSSPGESQEAQDAAAQDEGTYPEPIADFLSSGSGLNLNEERANNLLDSLIEDEDNAMTADMVEDYGGKDALVEQVV